REASLGVGWAGSGDRRGRRGGAGHRPGGAVPAGGVGSRRPGRVGFRPGSVRRNLRLRRGGRPVGAVRPPRGRDLRPGRRALAAGDPGPGCRAGRSRGGGVLAGIVPGAPGRRDHVARRSGVDLVRLRDGQRGQRQPPHHRRRGRIWRHLGCAGPLDARCSGEPGVPFVLDGADDRRPAPPEGQAHGPASEARGTVTGPVPRAARRVLEEGVLCHLAVRTPWGPHLTPVVFVLDGGRLWLTTSRRSVKARTWKDDPFIGGLVVTGDRAVSFHGRVRTYDALDPLSWPAATVAGPRLVSAATKFSLKNARFFAGYAVDARRVPLAWTPPGRVFARIDLSAGWLLSIPDGSVLERWGERTGRRRTSFRASFEPLGRTRPLDLRVPRDVRSAGGPGGQAPLALDEGIGPPVVLPARW